MFILSEIEDKVRVAPADLGRPVLEAVTAVIEKNYIDKVDPFRLWTFRVASWDAVCYGERTW